jgi:hypothetical protein
VQRQAWASYYLVGLEVCWWASGAAYLISAAMPPATVLMAGVFVALILGAFVQVRHAGQRTTGSAHELRRRVAGAALCSRSRTNAVAL